MKIQKTLVTLENSGSGYYDRAAICDHIMQGYMAGTFARFNNPSQQVSAHFGVSRNGLIVQYVEMNRWSYANGILQDGFDHSLDWLLECKVKGINPNKRTISIEHEGLSGEPMPDAQYGATLALHKFIIETWPTIKVDRKHIVGHYQISPKDKPFCPGPSFPFDRLIGDLATMSENYTKPGRAVPGNIPVPKEFTDFWFDRGGLPIFGYPASQAVYSVTDFGRAIAVQYFERARFELMPDGSVVLGLVGNEAMRYRAFGKDNPK